MDRDNASIFRKFVYAKSPVSKSMPIVLFSCNKRFIESNIISFPLCAKQRIKLGSLAGTNSVLRWKIGKLYEQDFCFLKTGYSLAT